MTTLFEPLKLGPFTLPNRIIMAPLTRARSGPKRVPNALMAEYYAQRATAGLILSEATAVSPMGVGYTDTPGIWSDEQADGWKLVTRAVHAARGRIFLQLWHVGRISDPYLLNGERPVAPSAIAAEGFVSNLLPQRPYVLPRALETDEIPGIVEEFRVAARNAEAAGFDGVELHGANGYLLDQFLQDGSNLRTDEYGGSVENRARFLLEVTDAVVSVFGADRVGVHLAPQGPTLSMFDSNPEATFGYAARELGRRRLGFLCIREPLSAGKRLLPMMREMFSGVVIANEGFTPETAREIVETGEADAVAFGKMFIANPDLPRRILRGTVMNRPRPELYRGSGAEGYSDYPALPED